MNRSPISSTRVAAIDIAPFLAAPDSEASASIIHEVRRACERSGFLAIRGHNIPQGHLDAAFASTRAFFDLPQPEKDIWHPTGPSKQRGYHRVASRGLAYTLDKNSPPDLRESVFVGPLTDHRHQFEHDEAATVAYWPNSIPDTPSGTREAIETLYREFERLALDLLELFAAALSVPQSFFTAKMDHHFSILGIHHYPPLVDEPRPGQLRTGAHTDFGAMTILAMTEGEGGLEAQMPNGRWTPVFAQPNELIVNIGDMLARWTNNQWTSTLHRVVNPASVADARSRRQSIGFFVHPNYDAEIACLPTCLAPDASPVFEATTAGAHIAAKIDKSHTGAP